MTHTKVSGVIFLSKSPKFSISQNLKFTSPFSIQLFHTSKTAYTIGSLRNYDHLKQYFSLILKSFPDRHLTNPQECFIPTDCGQIDPDCIRTTVAQPYRHLS